MNEHASQGAHRVVAIVFAVLLLAIAGTVSLGHQAQAYGDDAIQGSIRALEGEKPLAGATFVIEYTALDEETLEPVDVLVELGPTDDNGQIDLSSYDLNFESATLTLKDCPEGYYQGWLSQPSLEADDIIDSVEFGVGEDGGFVIGGGEEADDIVFSGFEFQFAFDAPLKGRLLATCEDEPVAGATFNFAYDAWDDEAQDYVETVIELGPTGSDGLIDLADYDLRISVIDQAQGAWITPAVVPAGYASPCVVRPQLVVDDKAQDPSDDDSQGASNDDAQDDSQDEPDEASLPERIQVWCNEDGSLRTYALNDPEQAIDASTIEFDYQANYFGIDVCLDLPEGASGADKAYFRVTGRFADGRTSRVVSSGYLVSKLLPGQVYTLVQLNDVPNFTRPASPFVFTAPAEFGQPARAASANGSYAIEYTGESDRVSTVLVSNTPQAYVPTTAKLRVVTPTGKPIAGLKLSVRGSFLDAVPTYSFEPLSARTATRTFTTNAKGEADVDKIAYAYGKVQSGSSNAASYGEVNIDGTSGLVKKPATSASSAAEQPGYHLSLPVGYRGKYEQAAYNFAVDAATGKVLNASALGLKGLPTTARSVPTRSGAPGPLSAAAIFRLADEGTVLEVVTWDVSGQIASGKAASWKRLAGSNALGTMRKIVNEGFSQCDSVVVATSGGYWDALAASSLAGKLHCPVLLTNGKRLSSETSAEIKRLGAKTAYIAGGTAAVSASVERQIKALGCATKRLAGANAIETAVRIAEETGLSSSRVCLVATSATYQDALSASPYSYVVHAPIFLTDTRGRITSASLEAMKRANYDWAVVLGGTAAVSKATEQSLKAAGMRVYRLGGANAYETSAKIAEWELNSDMCADGIAVATCRGYWDALTGAALCGANRSVLVLGDEGNVSAMAGVLARNRKAISQGYVFGGTAAVAQSVMNYCVATTR